MILQQGRYDGVIAVEKSPVLHNRCAFLSDQIGSGTDTYPLFLAAQWNVNHVGIRFNFMKQLCQVDIRQSGDQADAGSLQSVKNGICRVCFSH